MRKSAVILNVLLASCVMSASAQEKPPVPTRNAALRYWLAFADLQDPPSDKATTELLEKTAAGEVPWDEAKLGSILDKNQDAIERMQRATKLPDCDWGLEYELGPSASIAYVPRARVLARLNTLHGMRLAAKGETEKAVATWLAGIRFSQHLAQGGSLIFLLVAKTALLSNFQALRQSRQSGILSEAQRKQIAEVVGALPESGFDWGHALWFEQNSIDWSEKRVAEAANSSASYRELTGHPAPANFTVPRPSEIAAFHKVMHAAEAELSAPPKAAADELKELQESVQALHALYRAITPSFTHVNDARMQIADARSKLLQALGSR